MIVTSKFNEENPIKITDNNLCHIYKFEDGTYCRLVVIDLVNEYVECDCNGDTWFKVLDEKIDYVIPQESTDAILEHFPDITFDVSVMTSRQIHKFVNDFGDGYSEIKSGLYYIGQNTRPFYTIDEEYQFYFDKYADVDLGNITAFSTFTSEL
jgi:hypothetical protein